MRSNWPLAVGAGRRKQGTKKYIIAAVRPRTCVSCVELYRDIRTNNAAMWCESCGGDKQSTRALIDYVSSRRRRQLEPVVRFDTRCIPSRTYHSLIDAPQPRARFL